MTMTDPIADYLTRIRNAIQAKHERVDMPRSRMKEQLSVILKEEGFILDYQTGEDEKGFPTLRLYLKYGPNDERVITGLEKVSKAGCRKYVKSKDIPQVLGGLGVNILSTSQGVMSGASAQRKGLGGEILCNIW